MEELDLILVSQHNSCKRRLKAVKKLRKILKDNNNLDLVEEQINKNIIYLETFIIDKSLFKKKIKKDTPVEELFKRNIFIETYRNVSMITILYSRIMLDYFDSVMKR